MHQTEVHRFLRDGALRCVFQPIVDVCSNRTVDVEALARFDDPSQRPPDYWFGEAARMGLGVALEVISLNQQLSYLNRLPQDICLSLNVSPEVVTSGILVNLLVQHPLQRIVLELTEHTLIHKYLPLEKELAPLRGRGLRLAVDDAGAGYATFRHILKLTPDIIKLDLSLTRDVDSDRARRALASALFRFAEEMGSTIIPEGVETREELQTLQAMGGVVMQGYLFGRPVPFEELVFSS